ncbi:ovostatin-like [Platysternon megacephalum]|uniref:Ovostatin-like n=1 Tax=Platysternon megacephalum TaxID=55544 RepID=A0A4D9DN31_9SAUR|nr:ovostatin-like [Platysternon megacephalum]
MSFPWNSLSMLIIPYTCPKHLSSQARCQKLLNPPRNKEKGCLLLGIPEIQDWSFLKAVGLRAMRMPPYYTECLDSALYREPQPLSQSSFSWPYWQEDSELGSCSSSSFPGGRFFITS